MHYTLEGGRITIDLKRRDDKIADAERLDGKHALMSTRITMGTKKDGIEKAFCCIKQPIGLRPIRHWLDGRVKALVHPITDTNANHGCAGDRVSKV